jgi:hypothetical protein
MRKKPLAGFEYSTKATPVLRIPICGVGVVQEIVRVPAA